MSTNPNSTYNLYSELKNKPFDYDEAKKFVAEDLHEVQEVVSTEKVKERNINSSNIATARVNLLVRPKKYKPKKVITKNMRRPLDLKYLKCDFFNESRQFIDFEKKAPKTLKVKETEEDNQRKLAILNKMNELWNEYISKIESNNMENSLVSADMHGSKMKVVQSKNPSYLFIEGICVYESLNVFVVATLTNPIQFKSLFIQFITIIQLT